MASKILLAGGRAGLIPPHFCPPEALALSCHSGWPPLHAHSGALPSKALHRKELVFPCTEGSWTGDTEMACLQVDTAPKPHATPLSALPCELGKREEHTTSSRSSVRIQTGVKPWSQIVAKRRQPSRAGDMVPTMAFSSPRVPAGVRVLYRARCGTVTKSNRPRLFFPQ